MRDGKSDYVNDDTRERALAEALALMSGYPDPTIVLSRFMNEIRHFMSDTASQSGPKGLPLKKDYMPERLHPQHQFEGGAYKSLLESAQELVVNFLTLKGLYASPATFIEWVSLQNVPSGRDMLWLISELGANRQNNMVRYLDMVSRQRYVIEPGGDGLLHCRKPKDSPGSLGRLEFDREPFDSALSTAALNGTAGMAIWVQGPSGRFYSSTESQKGKFHHSSFLAGRDVKAAGDWKVVHGSLEVISAISGHYRPPLEALKGALEDLRLVSAALLTNAKVLVYSQLTDERKLLDANQFCALTGDALKAYKAYREP
jgi:hypothetical protein